MDDDYRDFSMLDVETALGEPYAPPPPDCPGCRVLFADYVEHAMSREFGALLVRKAGVLVGGLPDELWELNNEIAVFRQGKSNADVAAFQLRNSTNLTLL